MSSTASGLPDPDDLEAISRHRLEILEAYAVAMDRRDELMTTIGSAVDAGEARARLRRDFDFTEVQAAAVLDLQLHRFASFERARILEESARLRSRLDAS